MGCPEFEPIERAGPAELMYLSLQRSGVPEQFGAVLVLEPRGVFDVRLATSLLNDRVRAVPRMRQRLRRVPPGCGRPFWVDDASYTVERHVDHVVCAPPGDEGTLLDVASGFVTRPLPLDRPLWAALFVTGLHGGRVALVIVVQHALADGIGGLAILGGLFDGAPAASPRAFPAVPPSTARLASDACRSRIQALTAFLDARCAAAKSRRTPTGTGSRRAPPAPRIGRATRCALLRPTGPERHVAIARARLDDLRSVAHQHDATVNDVLLAAIGGALRTTLEKCGEHVPAIIAGVPVAERRATTADDLNNRFRSTRAAIPSVPMPLDRLERVVQTTRIRKQSPPGLPIEIVASALVRAATAIGVYDWYMRRQRYLHTVVTNLHGPDGPQSFGDAAIVQIIPLAVGGGGNVTVTFAALSYAGSLSVSMAADRRTDLAGMTAALKAELDALTALGRTAPAAIRRSPTASAVP